MLTHGERYGLELVADSNGRLKRGTVYVTLGRMEQKGLVESRIEASGAGGVGSARRLYSPTPLGKRILRAAAMMRKLLAVGVPR